MEATSTNWATEQMQYVDSLYPDDMGNDCAYYAEQSKTNKKLCASSAAKKLCPVACKGKRQCYDGSSYVGYIAPEKPKTYRIWERVMNLKRPAKQDGGGGSNGGGKSGMVCPGKSVNRTKILSDCKRLSAQGPGAFGPSQDYENTRGNLWPGFKRLNLTDCEEVEAALGDEYCSWDDSWLEEFTEEVKARKRFSLRFCRNKP